MLLPNVNKVENQLFMRHHILFLIVVLFDLYHRLTPVISYTISKSSIELLFQVVIPIGNKEAIIHLGNIEAVILLEYTSNQHKCCLLIFSFDFE